MGRSLLERDIEPRDNMTAVAFHNAGDTIELDTEHNSISVGISYEILAQRRGRWKKPPFKAPRKPRKIHAECKKRVGRVRYGRVNLYRRLSLWLATTGEI